jgi:hypothetical protein
MLNVEVMNMFSYMLLYRLAGIIVWFKNVVRYLRGDKLHIDIYPDGDGYKASAFDGYYGVYNNYGSTPEQAKEMALYKLKKLHAKG